MIKDKYPGRFVLFYEQTVKEDIEDSYNKVAEKVDQKGPANINKEALLKKRGYTEEQIAFLG